jgi:hypothetical protein
MLFFRLRDSKEQEVPGSLSANRQNNRGKETEDHFPVEAGRRGSHYYWVAVMSTKKKNKTQAPDQSAIDEVVIKQAEDDSAWDKPTRVKRPKVTSLSIPGELASRAAFLAKLHRESGLEEWVERVLRERVELEEGAFSEAKKQLAS